MIGCWPFEKTSEGADDSSSAAMKKEPLLKKDRKRLYIFVEIAHALFK
jgi:hypothetical protein